MRPLKLAQQQRVFSTQVKLKEQIKTPVLKTQTDILQQQTLLSEYGDLLNIKPTRIIGKEPTKLIQVEQIDDNTPVKKVLKDLERQPNTFFLFSPKGHYKNAMTLYKTLKSRVNERYYGVIPNKRSKNRKVKKEGTAFDSCESPFELFHRQRMVKMNVKQTLGRVGLMTLRNGSIEIQGEGKPEEIKGFKELLEGHEKLIKREDMYKRDFFAPFPFIEGVISQNNMQNTGIKINCLKNRLIYPYYGVWPPTQQQYLDLFQNYLKQNKNLKGYKTAADLGCGTGVLSIILKESGFNGYTWGFDSNQNAIESTQFNSQVFGLFTQLKTVNLDLLETYGEDMEKKEAGFYKQMGEELGAPPQYDIILANPPWIQCSKVSEVNPLDNAVYDQESELLKAFLQFTKVHLSSKGEAIFIYSDLGHNLGLEEKERVENLAKEKGLLAQKIDETALGVPKKVLDPLKQVKSMSKVQLIKIVKQ